MKSNKAAKSPSRQPGSKTRRSAKSVADYLSRVPEPARRNFEALRAIVRGAVPDDAIEVISYGIPAFKRGIVLVWFAAFSQHCSLFPTAAVIERFKEELQGFACSKGTVQFPLDRPIPAQLVKKLVKERVAEIRDKRKH